MAAGAARSCCRFACAMALVPVAVLVAVLLETPVVTEISAEGTVGGGPAADVAGAAAAAATEAATEGAGETRQYMGSGNMFDRIAFVYDSTNKWMSLGLDQYWRKALVQDCLRLERGDRVLDLATGTADVGLLVGKRLSELAEGPLAADSVLGVDPSVEMLRHGVVKVERDGLVSSVRLALGDAQDLSSVRTVATSGDLAAPGEGVATGSIDKISMSFGIRNVPDRPKAFREMRRVLRSKPSSRVCILEFSLPDGQALLSRVARGFITHIVPFIGRVATFGSGSEEYEYLERSILQFPKPQDFAASMAREGLPVRTITSFAYGAVHLYAASPAQ